MDGKWETVVDKKKQHRKQEQGKQVSAKSGADTVQSAFASLDAWKAPGTSGTNAANGQSTNDEYSSASRNGNSSGANGSAQSNGIAKPQPKIKVPKIKQPKKPTPAQAAEALHVSKVKKVIADVRSKYKDSDRSQLETVADYLLGIFHESEVLFLNILADTPLSQSADVPVSVVPEGVATQLQQFFQQVDGEVMVSFVGSLVLAAFEGVPESANSKEVVAKTKVGVMVTLALVVRSVPNALLALAPSLLARGRSLSSPGRLPLLLWLVTQATRGQQSVGVAVWVRVLLPQLLGLEEAVAVSATGATRTAASTRLGNAAFIAALDCLILALAPGGTLMADASNGLQLPGSSTASERQAVVPPALLAAMMHAVHSGESGLPPPVLQRLAALLKPLQILAISGAGSGGFDSAEMLRLCLDSAATADPTSEQGNAVIQDAAFTIVLLMEADDTATDAWPGRHKAQLRGSARVLSILAEGLPLSLQTLATVPAKREHILVMLGTLRQRHRFHLQNNKGWQSAAARESDEAAERIEEALKKGASVSHAGGMSWTVGSMLAIGILSAVSAGTEGGLLAFLQHPRIMGALATLRHSPAGDAAADAASQGYAAVQPYIQQAAAAAEPYTSAAAAAAVPAVAQLKGVLAPGLKTAQELVMPAVQQAVKAISAAINEVASITEPYLQQAAGFLGFAANATATS